MKYIMAPYNKQTIQIILSAAIVAAIFGDAWAAVYTQSSSIHPAHPMKCFDKITRKALLPNKVYQPKGICAVMTCNIEALSINIETCPYIEMPGCEELTTDPTWSFPKCCPQFSCVDRRTGQEFMMSA